MRVERLYVDPRGLVRSLVGIGRRGREVETGDRLRSGAGALYEVEQVHRRFHGSWDAPHVDVSMKLRAFDDESSTMLVGADFLTKSRFGRVAAA